MALIDEIKQICDRLAPLGWRDLLLRQGLDITASNLASELSKPLTIDRTLNGFRDFAVDGTRGIEPANPGRSLLYHALASPAVHPTANNRPSADANDYPTLSELDTLENYIYSVANRQLSDFPNAVIAVFAYQYRLAPRSPHRVHADIAYSRTGVARVGIAAANYNAAQRSFRVEASDGSENPAVLPARYGAFLAVERFPSAADVVLDRMRDDRFLNFIFPVHKLFPGSECLNGLNLSLEFLEYHINEKLRRIHNQGNIPLFPGFDVNRPPFVRDSGNSNDLVRLQSLKGSALLIPVEHPAIVRTANQRNANTGREEIVRFRVPAETSVGNRSNRFWTSHEISAVGNARLAPEYVNIRHQVVTSATGGQTLIDLNQSIPDEDEFLETLAQGGYEAAHFIDDTCDGCVVVRVNGLTNPIGNRPAYSLVTALDFFPLADQIDIERWKDRVVPTLREHFNQGSPSPLSEGRMAANPSIVNPLTTNSAFSRTDLTLTAIVGTAPRTPTTPNNTIIANLSTSFLPDAAANFFAPGWDVSLSRDNNGLFYASYGLGSPFPEDAKLCAALNSFWPAVAPDAARTFGLLGTPTAVPMLDEELGYHPNHPKVIAGQVQSRRGWDGEFGPFFESVNGLRVNFANRDRSDYVSNALVGQVRVSPSAKVDSTELIDRMEALRLCIRTIPPQGDIVAMTNLLLVVAEKVNDWSQRSDRADTTMTGTGYLYEFANVEPRRIRVTQDVRRSRYRVLSRFTCQITQQGLFWRENQGQFNFASR
jgi:hypothetical protein